MALTIEGERALHPDGDVLGEKPQNQYALCGENEEKMILFLSSSNDVRKML